MMTWCASSSTRLTERPVAEQWLEIDPSLGGASLKALAVIFLWL